jgi:hypothetical protein
VGHPGLEPGANGLRTQRLALRKALFLAFIGSSSRPIVATMGHSGHRDRLDRAGLLHAIARAREAKVVTEDHARTLVALVEHSAGRRS